MGVCFYFLENTRGGMVREGWSKYAYLLILMMIWSVDLDNSFEGMNMRADE